ncbi:MAG: choice-of-anchor I family protein [Cyanobacteria bacterium P01_A01_bin.114]
MMLRQTLGKLLPACVLAGAVASPVSAVSLDLVGRFDSGLGEGAAEISAYDPVLNRLFITNSTDNSIDIIDVSNPATPDPVSRLSLTPYGAGINSVAFKDGVLAVALAAEPVTDSGSVAFFDNSGRFLTQVAVGPLPDMLTFTPDGSKVLVANEGEPDGDIDPEGSVSIIDISAGLESVSVTTALFTAFDGQEEALRARGVRIFPDATAAQDLEPEYIAVSEDGQTAYVTLQEANTLGVLDVISGEFTDLIGLGLKEYPALDASDLDEGINIQDWPVFGLYMPDAIATYDVDGETYIVTANEGDDRGDAHEEGRGDAIQLTNVGSAISFGRNGVALSPSIDAALLEAEALGRLTISSLDGDTDGNGDIDQIVAYGGRSFSIWHADGTLVYDSGDEFEQITAQQIPDLFNSKGDPDSLDARSNAKGPEPEGVTVGTLGDRTLAFIGLERVGGVMVYDITDPVNAFFVHYAPNPPEDNSPEGLLYIAEAESPTRNPLLVTTNEVSGTTAIYEVMP